jgi:hypothetical protein
MIRASIPIAELAAPRVDAANVWTAELLPASGDLTVAAGATGGWGYTM